MIKFTIPLRRKATLTHEQFVDHHKTKHAPLFMSVEAVKQNVRRYVQEHAQQIELPGVPPTKYDGITDVSAQQG